jgi:very-short-patch-repair endonuclease
MKLITVYEKPKHYRGGRRIVTKLTRGRELRTLQTPAEEVLWQELRGNKLLGLKFRRQHEFGGYILDFFCAELGLVVELDGGIHDDPEQQQYDKARQQFLQDQNLRIVRFPNDLVVHQLDNVLQQLETICRDIDRLKT